MSRARKKIQKAAKAEMQPDEEMRDAVFLNPFGFTSKLMAKERGGVVGSMISKANGSEPLRSDTGLASLFPEVQMWVGLSNQRLLVWSHSTLSGKPKKLIHEVPSADVVSVTLDPQKAVHAFVIEFFDGTGRLFEAPKLLNDAPAFAATLNE